MKKIGTLISCFLIITSFYSQGENLLIENSSFRDGFSGWKKKELKENNITPVVDYSVYTGGQDDNYAAKIRVKKLSKASNNNPYGISLIGKLKPLKRNKKYKLTFWAKSRVAGDKINFLLLSSEETGSSGEYSLIKWRELDLKGNNDWQQFTVFFEAKTNNEVRLDVKNVGVKFGLGKRLGTTYLDNVSVTRVH